MRRRVVPEGIRITKVGLWYVLFTVVVAIAATNTGNNALYLVLALMLGVLVSSGVLSRQNVRGFHLELQLPPEVYANRPFWIRFEIQSGGLLWPRFFILLSLSKSAQPALIPFLPRRGQARGELEMMLPRRGRHALKAVHLSSLYPFGLFRKGVRHRVDLEALVFPEIFAAAAPLPSSSSPGGEDPSRERGMGHDLFSLRQFRTGDDPRSIHWKQTARTGALVLMEREAEHRKRLSILLDNGTGELPPGPRRDRFERLVSEAATAAVNHLVRGFQVELVMRERRIPFGTGGSHRFTLLEALALVEPVVATGEPLSGSDPRALELRFALDPPRGRPRSVEATA
jgi:uncharacterized protein (DUF58 family)